MRTRQIKAERYRAEGQRLRGEAELATNSEIRLQILNIAAQYDRLADSVAAENLFLDTSKERHRAEIERTSPSPVVGSGAPARILQLNE